MQCTILYQFLKFRSIPVMLVLNLQLSLHIQPDKWYLVARLYLVWTDDAKKSLWSTCKSLPALVVNAC